MKKNKNGFTLVELLAIIALLGLLIGIGVPGIMRISAKMKERAYNTKVGLIEQAGTLWGQDNKTLLQQTPNCEIKDEDGTSYNYNCKQVTINELIEEDYLKADSTNGENNLYIDPRDNSNIANNYVYIYKKKQ